MTGLDKLPAFMAHVVRYERPAFQPHDLLPEMAVMVTKPGWGRGESKTWRAKVIRKARVLIVLQEVGRRDGAPKRWTMRLDTQKEQGGQGNYVAYFRTIGQWEYDQTAHEARQFLDEQGITIKHGGRWGHEEIRLARLIWPGRKGEQA